MDADQLSKGQRRRERLLELLQLHGSASIGEITEWLSCSEATARRDVEQLLQSAPLIRTVGGVIYDRSGVGQQELPFAEKEVLLQAEKSRIAEQAAALIEPGDIIGLSGGTTNYLLALRLKPRKGLTVVTNAVNIAMALAGSEIQVVVTGGVMRHNSFELCGPLGENAIRGLHIGKMFIGVDGFSAEGGISTYSEQEAHTARALLERSLKTYALFDHTKVGRTSLFTIAPLKGLYAVVTDKALPPELAQAAIEADVRVYAVE